MELHFKQLEVGQTRALSRGPIFFELSLTPQLDLIDVTYLERLRRQGFFGNPLSLLLGVEAHLARRNTKRL